MMRLSLIPREKRYYDMLEDVAAVLVEAADEFAGLVEQFDETEKRTARLRDLEHRCDQAVARKVL